MHTHFFDSGFYSPDIWVYLLESLHCVKYAGLWVFSDPHIPVNDLIKEFVLTRKNIGQRKPVLWHNLRSVYFMKF